MASITALHPSRHEVSSIPVNQDPVLNLPHPPQSTSEFDPVPRGPATTTLSFYKPPEDGSKPFNYVEEPPEGQPQRNFGSLEAQVEVNDARGREKEFSLESNAFLPVKGYPHNPDIDWNDDENIKRVYYPEVERILKEQTGGDRVLLFDHTIRRNTGSRNPVNRAHIDQTAKAAEDRVRFHLPDEADKLVKGRYRIINVWRPLNGAVESNPLAFADSRTVSVDDIVGVEHRYPDRTGETAGVKHNPQHKWYYWSGMENDERLLLLCSDNTKPLNRVPHSAFVDPRSTEQSKPRESIEVRALVFG